MKLRNKKTGEIYESYDIKDLGERGYKLSLIIGCYAERPRYYNTKTELYDEWEEFEPADPLIKDQKIRKAVRAWANVQGIKRVKHIEGTNSSDFWHMFEYGGNGSNRGIIHWGRGVIIGNLEDGKDYTITELCGNGEKAW